MLRATWEFQDIQTFQLLSGAENYQRLCPCSWGASREFRVDAINGSYGKRKAPLFKCQYFQLGQSHYEVLPDARSPIPNPNPACFYYQLAETVEAHKKTPSTDTLTLYRRRDLTIINAPQAEPICPPEV